MLTGYQPFAGDWHVARRWQERTRYRIIVIPDWNEPTQACRVQVQEFTETRAAEGMTWKPDLEVQRPERSGKMLKTLDAAIKSRGGK